MNKTPPPEVWADPAFEQSVRDTAYFLWEHDGRPGGKEHDYWYRALEQCLRQRQADELLLDTPPERRTELHQ